MYLVFSTTTLYSSYYLILVRDIVAVNHKTTLFSYDFVMDFKTRLKEEMEYKGIQHKELAAMADIKPRALLTYVASNPSMPPADVAVKIAKALGVSVEYLVTGEDFLHNSKYAEIQEIVKDLSSLNKEQLDTLKKMIHALV